MTHITITQTFNTIENLVLELNKLPTYNREDILEVKTYDGWLPMYFMFIDESFVKVLLTKYGEPCIMDNSKNNKYK